MIYKLTSIKVVINKITRDLGILHEEIPYQDYIEWMAEALKHIGAYPQFLAKEIVLNVENYRAELPCDFYKLIRFYSDINNTRGNLNYSFMDNADLDENRVTTKDYYINNNTITYSEREGQVKIHYLAFPVDEEGYPLVPDNQSFFDALFWKVAYQLCIRGYGFKNKYLSDLEYVRRKWNFYCKQARGEANAPDLERLERIKNNWLSLVPRTRSFDENFSTSGLTQNRVADARYGKLI